MSPRLSFDRSGDGDAPAGASAGEKDALNRAADGVRAAMKERKQRLAGATKQRDAAQRRHAHAVSQSRKALEETRKPRKLAGGRTVPGGASLFDDHVVVKGISHPLGPEVNAVVDSAGNISRTRRHTLTRFALIGPFSLFTPKKTKHDDRELFLLLEGPDWAELFQCNPDQQVAVRHFAQQLNLAARNATQAVAAREQNIAAAESRLRAAEANTAEIEVCEHALVDELSNKTTLEKSLVGLHVLLESYPEPQSRSARKAAETANEGQRALDASRASRPLPAGAERRALPAGTGTSEPPFWPPPPGWSPNVTVTDPPPSAPEEPTLLPEESALPPVTGTNAPPFWPPPPGWEPGSADAGDQAAVAPPAGTENDQAGEAPSASAEPRFDEELGGPTATQLDELELEETPGETAIAGAEPPVEDDEAVAMPENSPRSEVATSSTDEPSVDVIDQIKRLGELRDSGLITGAEFEEKKRELLDRL